MDRVFDRTNPNAEIFTIPTLEGTDEDDNGHGSIGDATHAHISYLSKYCPGDRQLWEDLITTRNGLIFRAEPSTNTYDPDPYNLKGKDMQQYFEKIRRDNKGRFLPENTFSHLREAMEEESARQTKSEDAYDRCELLSYDQLQRFPGMMSCIDIPQTPKDRLVFMGETTQNFYDYFPLDCPDAPYLVEALGMLNREEEKLTDEYLQYLQQHWNNLTSLRPYTRKYLCKLADNLIAGQDPVLATQEALTLIDDCSRKEYINKSAQLTKKEDPIYMLLIRKEKEWEIKAKSGEGVYSQIKAFGRDLFTLSRHPNFRKMFFVISPGGKEVPRTAYWDKYKRLKTKYAPRVVVNGVNINQASIAILRTIFGKKAENIWFSRPFETIYHLRQKGLLTKECMAFDEPTENILAVIDTISEQCKKDVNLEALNKYRIQLMSKQHQDLHIDWSQVWNYYNIIKSDILKSLEVQRTHKPTREGLIQKWLQEHKDG